MYPEVRCLTNSSVATRGLIKVLPRICIFLSGTGRFKRIMQQVSVNKPDPEIQGGGGGHLLTRGGGYIISLLIHNIMDLWLSKHVCMNMVPCAQGGSVRAWHMR